MADGKVVIDSKVDDKGVDKGLKGIQGKLDKTSRRFNSIGKNMTKYVTAPIVAVGTAAFKAADDIDKALRDIRVGTGATGKDLEQLEEDFKSVFKRVPADANEVANAIANLNTMTGASGEVLQELTYHVLEASRMLGEDGVANSEAFGKALVQWQIPAEQGPALMDSLYKATQDYGIGLGELLDQLNMYGPVMQNAGFSTVQTADFFGRLNKAGINVRRLMPGINKAFRDWAAEGKDLQTELGKTIEKIRNAESETEALAIASDVFGAQGAQRMVTAIRSGAIPAMEEWGIAIDNQTGLIADSAEENMTFGEKMRRVWNELALALEPFGDVMLKLAKDVLPVLTEWLSKLADWFQSLSPHMTRLIVIVSGIVAAIGPLLVVLSSTINVFKTIIPVVTKVWSWFSRLRTLFTVVRTVMLALTGPVGVVIAIITALIGVGVALYKNWDSVKQFGEQIWGAIANFFGEVGTKIRESVTKNFSKLRDGVVERMKKISESVRNNWENARKATAEKVENLKNTARDKFNNVRNAVKDRMERTRETISNLWERARSTTSSKVEQIRKAARDKFNGLKNAVSNKMSETRRKIEEIWGKAQSFLSGVDLFQVGKDIIQGLISGIGSMASAVWEKAKEIAGGIKDGIMRVLRMSSPSKETFYAGEMVGEGLEKGMHKMIPSVLKKAEEIGRKAIPDIKPVYEVAVAGGAGKTETMHRTVNLNYGEVKYNNKEDIIAHSRKLKRLRDRTMLAKGVQV